MAGCSPLQEPIEIADDFKPCSCCNQQKPNERPESFFCNQNELKRAREAGCLMCGLVLNAVSVYTDGALDNSFEISVFFHTGINVRLRPRGRYYIELEVFTTKFLPLVIGGYIQKIDPERVLLGDTSSDGTIRTIRGWIDNCFDKHFHCSKESPSQLPKRILEITDSQVFLRESTTGAHRYASLSHCWGPEGPVLQLKTATMHQLKMGTLIQDLPKTFREAVDVCKRLNIWFIWIDALCIKQDDNDDWAEAAATMADTYELAYITLAASFARNSNGGLYSRSERFQAKYLPACHSYVREAPPRFPTYNGEIRSDNWPLLRRCWVYQERHLSPRIVHYAEHQVYWECKAQRLNEDGTGGVNFVSKQPRYEPEMNDFQFYTSMEANAITCWHKIVQSYSGLDLTFESDHFPAVAALVERLLKSKRRGDHYFAGMWENSLLDDMNWRVHLWESRRQRPTEWQAPTWSWASIRSPVSYEASSTPLPTVEVLNLHYDLIGPAHMGKISNASVTITAPVVRALVCSHFESRVDDTYKMLENIVPECGELEFVVNADYDYHSGMRPVKSGQELWVLLLLRIYDKTVAGLLLRKSPVSILERTFERIGHVNLMNNGKQDGQDYMRSYIAAIPLEVIKIV